MSVSAVAPTPFYHDPERLQIGLPQAAASEETTEESADGKHLSMFANDEEPSFWDVLDVINPLQHIPVIGNLYREATGDQIGVGARLVGGTLFGGPLGLVASAVDCMVEESTGKDAGGHMLALFRDESDSAPTTQVAQTKQAPETTAPQAQVQAEATPPPAAKTAAAKAQNDGAPVITLPPAAGTPVGAPQPLVFSLNDGVQGAAAPAVVSARPLPADPAALQALADPKQAAAAMPVSGGRIRPTPPRNSTANAQPLTPITVPVSTSGMRSNTPITGRAPASSLPIQRNTTPQPMPLPEQAGTIGEQTAAGPDWFSAAWGQALDKYQRANQRNDKAAPSAASVD